MRHFLRIAAAVAAIVTSICAHASFIDANFFGTVSSQVNAGFGLNSPITGEFIYDTSSARFLSFTIGGQTIAPGFASTAAITPDLFTALYRAQISPVQQGGTVNSTFTLDLEALNTPWPSNNAVALLSNAGQLATNLDLLNSSFGFFMGNGCARAGEPCALAGRRGRAWGPTKPAATRTRGVAEGLAPRRRAAKSVSENLNDRLANACAPRSSLMTSKTCQSLQRRLYCPTIQTTAAVEWERELGATAWVSRPVQFHHHWPTHPGVEPATC